MAEAYGISLFSMFLCFLLLFLPVLIDYYFKLNLIKSIFISVSRMIFQLAFIGIILTFLFDYNNSLINIVWVFIMLIFAAHSVVTSSKVKLKETLIPFTISIIIANIPILLYFNKLVLNLPNILDARYFIPIAGMLLGNSLQSNIVGISDFYKNLIRNEHRYMYKLSVGATKYEALSVYIRKSIIASIKPTIANMATVGIVFLPGMMTGQILSGSDPMLAIKYQIAIMITIFVSSIISILLCNIMLIEHGFEKNGMFRKEILIDE